MMTTMAALLGGGAADAEPRHGLGTAPAARLHDVRRSLVSQALTLFTTPVIFLYLDSLAQWLSDGSGKARPMAEAQPPAASTPETRPEEARETAWADGRAKAAE